MGRARRVVVDLWDRFTASDPGLIRLSPALSTVCAIVLTLAVLAAFRAPVPVLVTGALTAMVSTVAVTEPRPRDQALTLAAGVPTALATTAVGTVLAPYRVAADALFILLIFGALYIRRFGQRSTTLGVFVFELFFVSQFVAARSEQLPELCLAVVVAFAGSAVMRLGVLRAPPERILQRLRQAFRLRLTLVLDALIEVAEGGPGAPRADRAVDDLRRRATRLDEAALMIRTRLESATVDERTAATVQRRVVEAETAVERLSVLLLRFLWPATDIDSLTRHPARPVAEFPGPSLEARDAAALPSLVSALRALRALFGPDRLRQEEAGHLVLRERLLGYGDDEGLPDASPALQDVFRSAGDFARAVVRLRGAVEGAAEGDGPLRDGPDAARSREETDAGEAVPAEDGETGSPTGLARPSTRTALQVSTGSVLAVVGGELLSPQRWYWAVFTCWVVFIGTTSTGEILVRGSRRLIGTVVGVVTGIALASLLTGHVWAAFALAILSVFGMYYTSSVSYTLMTFFVTTMIGMLYTLLRTFSPDVLLVRIEETALGIACGLIAALFVLPTRTRKRTDQLLRSVLERLRVTLAGAMSRVGGACAGDLLEQAGALDSALQGLRLSVDPLTDPISPLRARRRTARQVMGLLETCAFHARSLAATAVVLGGGLRIGADPGLTEGVRRIDRNLESLIGRVAANGQDGSALERGPGMLPLTGARAGAACRPPAGERTEEAKATRRVLRHLQRLDEAVLGLGRTLGAPVRTEQHGGARTKPHAV